MTAPVPSSLPRSTTRGEQPTDGGGDGGREVEAVALALLRSDEPDESFVSWVWADQGPQGCTVRESYRTYASVAIRELTALRSSVCRCGHDETDHGNVSIGCIHCGNCDRFDAARAALLAEQPGGGQDENGCPDEQHGGVDCPGDACRYAR